MKKVLVVAVAVAFAFSFSSCKKCTTCKYSYKNVNGEQTTYTYPEACGKKKDV